jgi:uncharacterized protein (DUF2062 family)
MAPFRLQSLSPPRALKAARRKLRQAIEWVWRQEGSHGQRARGLAAGVFMGCFPIFGFQTLLGVALASLVRGNHLLAVAGTWISNPITDVPLIWFNYQMGSLLLGPGKGWPGGSLLQHETLRQLGWDFTSRLLLGSAVVGLVMGPLSGVLCLRWLKRRQPLDTGGAHQ